MTPHPYTIRIFVAQGDPDGLRLVERSNWTGRGVVFPRVLLGEVKGREEFAGQGVYLLLGPDEGEGQGLYIGKAEMVGKRLEQHHKGKDFWTWAVFFVDPTGQLNTAHAAYLEARLIALAQEAKRARLENNATPTLPRLSQAEQADVETFLDYMLGILPLLGIDAFEKPPTPKRKRALLHLHAKGVEASGFEAAQGFVVLKGSTATASETPSLAKHGVGVQRLRGVLRERGILIPERDGLVMTQDYTFNSPSQAASVLRGHNTNGRTTWKNERGRSLMETREEVGNVLPG